MSERAISKEALLASLRDIRLPEAGAGDIISDLTAMIALAGVTALLFVGLFRLLSHPRLSGKKMQAHSIAQLPEAERRLALLHLLKDRAPDRFAELRARLYRPDSDLDTATLEAEVACHV